MPHHMFQITRAICFVVMSAVLVACGGGSSSASAPSPVAPPSINDPNSHPEAPAAARATLVWTAPTQREDGTEFIADEIAWYEVYHIEDHSGAMDVIEIASNVDSYEIDLAAGSHELGVAVVDVHGVKSQMSELQTVVID